MRPWILCSLLVLPRLAWADADGDGYDTPADCDDRDRSVYPGATEFPVDGKDSDCDGQEICYQDRDGDGYGRTSVASTAFVTCVGPSVSPNSGDCNDDPAAGGADVYPFATEFPGDGVDQNCDGLELCYDDDDADGYGGGQVSSVAGLVCVTFGLADSDDDCEPQDPTIHPGAFEACDNVDNDCNGVVDDLERRWYADRDFDGYGDDAVYVDACPTQVLPSLGTGGRWVVSGGDCNNTNPDQSPGRDEFCDGLDNDCNRSIDDGMDPSVVWYVDGDQDGYGRVTFAGSVQGACPPANDYAGYSPFNTDCKDTDATVHPLITPDDWTHPPLWGLEESSEQDRDPAYVGDGMDQDCDSFDLCYVDLDDDRFGGPGVDGHAPRVIRDNNLSCRDRSVPYTADNDLDCDDSDPDIGPGQTEILGDGIDQDCDGVDACPSTPDLDGDGVGDGCDVCPEVSNPDQTDADGDGLGDACDDCRFISNAPPLTDPPTPQVDVDMDGVGDVCDTCVAVADPDQDDHDYDGIGSACDNCPDDSNPDQADADADGTGDRCTVSSPTTPSSSGCHGWGGAYAMFPFLVPVTWFRRRDKKRGA